MVQAHAIPAPSEETTQRMVVDLLTAAANPGWLWWHTPNGENRSYVTGARLKGMGTLAGVSDILLIAPGVAQLHALELKKLGKTPTKDQYAFLGAVDYAGGKTAWTDSFDGALAILKEWGAVRVTT